VTVARHRAESPGAARRAAVLGSPVDHSLSPILHTAAYAELGLTDWSYTRIECTEDELPDLLAGLGPEWAGLSLTMPLKRAALAVADSASDLAVAVGAANTMILGPDGRHVDNTDVIGMVDALRAAGVERVEAAVVLGAGGTAQAAIAALAELGERHPTVVVRDLSRAGPVQETAARLGVDLRLRLWEGEELLDGADVVISTAPRGAADLLTPSPGSVVFDVVYDPWPTPLAARALGAGCRIVSGLDLLLHQAAHQVRLMTGRPAPLDAMRSALVTTASPVQPLYRSG
jgi:shikimate dehydrogenase